MDEIIRAYHAKRGEPPEDGAEYPDHIDALIEEPQEAEGDG